MTVKLPSSREITWARAVEARQAASARRGIGRILIKIHRTYGDG